MPSQHESLAHPQVASPLVEQIARELSQAILDHRIAPGSKLSEDEVGEIYGAGRTVVRAALQALAHRELVEIRRNRGAFVAKPDLREAREVFEARALLEPRTARFAAERARAGDSDRLRRHIEAEHRAMEAAEIGRAVYLSGLFHNAVADIAGQKTIAAIIAALVSRSSLVIALYWKRRHALCESHAHLALTEAIAKGRGVEAEELMMSHLVDLVSGLDLSERAERGRTLREVLAGGRGRD